MAVRSGVLARMVSTGNTDELIGTVPAGDTWILKDARILNLGSGSAGSGLFATSAVGVIDAQIINFSTMAVDALLTWSGWFVMGPGDFLTFTPRIAGMHIWVSGTQLVGHI